MKRCPDNSTDNHRRWDPRLLLHTHKQEIKWALLWTWRASTKESQNYSLHRQNYGDHIMGVIGHFTPQIYPLSVNTTQDTYEQTLKALWVIICHKHQEVHGEASVFLHDNAMPHTVSQTRDQLVCFGWEIFGHTAYSLDLALSDLLRGCQFTIGAQVKNNVILFFHQQPTELSKTGLPGLVKRYSKCSDHSGNYVK